MGLFTWARRKSQAATATEVSPQTPSPFRDSTARQPSYDSDHEFTRSIPGAFPTSPPISPTLAPSHPEVPMDEVPMDEDFTIAGFDSMQIDTPATIPELPTDLGSHLHPRRPLHFTPTPSRTKRPPSVRSAAAARSVTERETFVDDPWNRHALAFEKLPFGRPVSAVQLFYPDKKPLPANRIASIYASEWEKRERERAVYERDLRRPTRLVPQGSPVRQLSRAWLDRVTQAMKSAHGHSVARSLSGDDLYQKDIATCIKPLAWLNDEIINAYLIILVQYLRQSTGNAGRSDRPRFHAFNSFFYSSLRDKGYQGVRRWANRAKIGGEGLLDVDTVFVPVHESSHWTLMVVRPSDRTIEYFDSLGSRGPRQVKVIKEWLRGELGTKYDDEEWTVLPSVSSPQDNGSDCGVFLLTNAKAIAIGIEPTVFGPSYTSLVRRKIVAELMNGGLHGEFDPSDPQGKILL
ncbi:hypothetical protein NUU61_004201 [Penicillium alfredii]|uniref:Ubiquitin-like protease family profile domain-containing protein n=1 Tax=Penicillium alfredii TaxID=1506179 RepID=A0A9W9FKN6_9EURO|nr:uncharacterized protein NUU61_004201 [Penicillium alfredii]KAJ5101979.1 hypothetical protein NUU61_004201 [Penicillium alfredii]